MTKIYKISSYSESATRASAWVILAILAFGYALPLFAEAAMPTVSINIGESDEPDSVVPAMKIIGLLTLLAVAPAILLMTTSFTRILIVLSFVRQAIGTQTMPPNQVLVGLAMFLTLFTMGPVIDHINEHAFTPYVEKKISQPVAFENAVQPIRQFMLAQTHENDISAFMNIAKLPKPKEAAEVPLRVLMPAFLVSELKTAFQIGFLIYIPFLVIDMVVSSVLMAMGMVMLPPTVVSLPFKLVLFVLVDGWTLIVEQLVKSFNII
jgi:flagellar biosynthetic protein FliP